MRDTVDFGIDLGTTNSAIAVVESGGVSVIKNNDGWDITPSAVWMPKEGRVHVGRAARDWVEKDPANATAEFKLEMGLADSRKVFETAGTSLTPPQLSAEVLKSLRADATHHCGAAPESAVITVPAAFALNQNKATIEAAKLAGFTAACPLVQEPTAAAFAYGFQDATDRAYWMVFDFGGGTFDAALVSKRDGDLRVLNHAGDPYLGGKLIDWALIERLLVPAAVSQLGLTDLRRDNPKWRGNFAKLKRAAEDAKIHLSRRDQVELMVDLNDASGNPVTFEHTLTRGELDSVAEPFYVRAINLCRDALAEAALGPDDIDRLLLVGGVTLSPGLRERLADPRHGLGIELDVSLDPTTVVARGAAIFASTVRIPRSKTAPVPAGQFAVELSYEPSVTTLQPTVGGRLRGEQANWTGYTVTLNNPQGQPPFRSAAISVNAEGVFVTDVAVDPHTTSKFFVELTDPSGARCELTSNTLTITHRDLEFGGVRLANSLGIQLAEQVFAPMLRKGATLPTSVREVFRTSAALHRSDADATIRIPVIHGERSRADRNRTVGMLEIRPRDIRIDLPAGSEVEVTVEVDRSSMVTVIADVPLVQAQFEAEIDLDNIRTKDPEALRDDLDEAEGRLSALRGYVAEAGSADAERRLAKLDEERSVSTARDQVEAAAVDNGAAATAEERLRDLQAELDDIADAVGLPGLVRDLRASLAEADELVRQHGDTADRQELAAIRSRADEAINAQDSVAVRGLIDRTGTLLFELERRSPDWSVKLFYTLQDMLRSSGQAGPLIQEGQRAIAANDRQGLDAVNQRLYRLLPKDEQDKVVWLGRA
ncbi:Hsp70 family protein [Streptomyces sp. 4R-3d]|uniref:Hsp70 family protein n=1 Tax=Streptomyces sp. 4R-3d TaxID=2559605 RepID=UPI0010740520|nr:Hsp70 family protein [Streptomyces sp. 4R-3d]TFI20873.1 Hsp70 family protein [Streptomyces sp. 4R-3d]